MVLRVITNNTFLDYELKEKIDKKLLTSAIDNQSTIMIETKQETIVFINVINIISLEIFDIPPIS
jgi:hypothetical protein